MALNCTLSAYRLGKDTLEREVAPRLLDAARQHRSGLRHLH
jgi:hypothetical protein